MIPCQIRHHWQKVNNPYKNGKPVKEFFCGCDWVTEIVCSDCGKKAPDGVFNSFLSLL